MGLNVVDGVFHSQDLFRVLIGYFDLKALFEGHHQLNDIQRIGPQVVDKMRRWGHFSFIDPKLFNDYLFDLLFGRSHQSLLLVALREGGHSSSDE